MQSSTYLLNRQIQQITKSLDSKLALSVLQWNTLARCYTSPKHYPLLPREVTEFDERKSLISQEIKQYNADVICLEEVDKRDLEFYSSIYPKEEYSFSYAKKPHSKDGTCIMIKKPFEVVEEQIIEHTDENGEKQNLVSQLVVAKYSQKESSLNKSLIVSACHLKASNFASVRLRQAKQIIEAIEQQKQKCINAGVEKDDIHVLVCGDFNDLPESESAQEFLTHKDLGLQSAFPDVEFTLFQRYGQTPYITRLVVDYILHSNNFVLTKKISNPEHSLIGEHGLLSKDFPSDHIPLFCELSLM